MRSNGIILFYLLLFSIRMADAQPVKRLTSYVDPFIGTGGHGHTYPGASVPFGMVQLSPDTRLDGWDGCSGYHASDSVIYGFSHTHLSGTGCSDYGDILLMPVVGDAGLEQYGYASKFEKSTEFASPGFYQVSISGNRIRVELTASKRAGLHRYSFMEEGDAGIVLDLNHRDKVTASSLSITGEDEVEGMRISQAWAENQVLYFVMRFSKPFRTCTLKSGSEYNTEIKEITGTDLKAYFNFRVDKEEQILVKVGLSAVNIEGARKNLESEIPGWDFDETRNQALSEWEKELGKIIVNGGTDDQMKIFYTSLYHLLLNPNIYSDVDGRYLGRDFKVHEAKGFDYYTVFSLWDTYRAAHPLLTLIDRKRTQDFIRTFIRQYEEGGMLPVWELSSNETGCMIGYHSVPVIADAYLKGIDGFDAGKALEAMKHSAEADHLGLKYYKKMGFIPAEKEGESVSKTLEYAYDDWCIAQVAKSLGMKKDYRYYIRRAQSYKNLFDKETGFIRAKMNGRWFSPFDPAEVNFNYTEANAWQYSFYVPQDISGLMTLLGGREAFSARLDSLFRTSSATTGREQADITGLIGQYAHGNEPSHHMAYLYDYTGEPWKTQALVHNICSDLYKNATDGLCGNEDCGQMSAWYIFSALGFYPVTPASGDFAIGSPIFRDAVINLENGKKFAISAENLSAENFYIRSATLNGKPYSRCFLTYQEIMNGGELHFVMDSSPDYGWGSASGDFPVTSITDELIVPVPSVTGGERTFIDSTTIAITTLQPGQKIRYTLDGTEPGRGSTVYSAPVTIREDITLKAIAFNDQMEESSIIEAQFRKIPGERSIRILNNYAPQYSGGGDNALIDMIRGSENFRTGTWQGYEGVDLVAVVDLGSEKDIRKVSLECLQDQGSWIFMPVAAEFYSSPDGKDFTLVSTIENKTGEHEAKAVIAEFSSGKEMKTRYIKVIAKNRGTCPEWHPGAGNRSWIFADEIIIE